MRKPERVLLKRDVIARCSTRVASGARGRVVDAAPLTLLILATELGTTLVISKLVRVEATYSVRTPVIASREELVDQAKAKLEALGLWVGVEQARRRSGNEPVVVATPQTLRGERLARFITWAYLGKATLCEFIELPRRSMPPPSGVARPGGR